MTRTEQHITETKSQRIFERIIPIEWVAREIKPDYGIDYIVEIFNNGQSTGKTFFVQLKGSTQEIVNNTFKKQFDIDNLEYYASFTLPVLIVFVSVTTEQIWVIWSNNLLKAFNTKKKQKNLSISLNENYIISKSSFENFANELDSTNKFGVSINVKTEKEKLLNESIVKWIKHFYQNSISIEFKYLPNHIELIYSSNESNDLIFTIKASDFTKEVIVKNISEDNIYLHRPAFDENDINDTNKDILRIIATCFAKYDVEGSLSILKKVIGKVEFKSQKELFSIDPIGLLILSKAKGQMPLFNALIKEIIDLKLYDLFFYCELAYFVADPKSKEFQQLRIENLSYLIQKTDNNILKGNCHYNLGNIYGANLNPTIAILHYFKARKLQPDYNNRLYWWRESASILFLKGHYKWAELFYRKSQEKNQIGNQIPYLRFEERYPEGNSLTIALIADCLFFQGKFKEANILFEEYITITGSISQEWILKNLICVEFCKNDLDSIKIEKNASLEILKKVFTLSSSDEIIVVSHEAINLNPLNGHAWFNLGVALDKKMQPDEALFAFVASGLIQDGDKEAQFNALAISLTNQKYEIMQSILLYIVEKHGPLVINDLADYIMNKDMPLDSKKFLIKKFSELIIKIKKEE